MGNKRGSLATRVHELEANGRDMLKPLGVARLVKKPMLFETARDGSFDWVVLPLADDPAFLAGELSIPTAQQQQLRRLSAAGIKFDTFLIAHEVPKGHGLTARPSKSDLNAALQRQHQQPFDDASAAIGKLSRVIRTVAVSAAVIPLAPLGLALLADPDPVLIGVLTEDGRDAEGSLSVMFEVIRW